MFNSSKCNLKNANSYPYPYGILHTILSCMCVWCIVKCLLCSLPLAVVYFLLHPRECFFCYCISSFISNKFTLIKKKAYTWKWCDAKEIAEKHVTDPILFVVVSKIEWAETTVGNVIVVGAAAAVVAAAASTQHTSSWNVWQKMIASSNHIFTHFAMYIQ